MKSRRKFSKTHHGSLNELNITPLLDLAFVLLVIFIITTPQMVNNLEMNLPSGKPPPSTEKPKITNIIVREGGGILLDGDEVTFAHLRKTLSSRRAEDKDLSVAVRGADQVDYQYVVNVLDLLRQLDITKVGLATATVAVQP